MGCMGCLGVLRAPIGAILGYIVSILCVGIGLAIVLSTQGTEFVFATEPAGSWRASQNFVLATLAIALVAGMTGGFVAARIGGRTALVVLLFVMASLGSLDAVGILPRAGLSADVPARPEPRTKDFDHRHIATWTDWPSWYRWGNTGSGVVGVALGGAFGVGAATRRARKHDEDDRA